GGPHGMLRDLRFATDFPNPADLQADPGSWLTGRDSDRVGVVHSTAMGAHGVGAGLMPRDRAPLADWAAQAFEPHLVRVPDHRRGKYHTLPRNMPKKPSGTKEQKEETKATQRRQQQHARRVGIARVLDGEDLSVAVLWQNPRT